MRLITRTLQWLIAPADTPRVYAKHAYRVSIDDEGAGEYLLIEMLGETGHEPGLLIDPDGWPTLRDAIDQAIADIRLREHPARPSRQRTTGDESP